MSPPLSPVEGKLEALIAANPFLDGPSEFLCKAVCDELKKVRAFALTFGEFIDPYMRMDYSIRNLPALRVYNESFVKSSQNWWITGELKLDCIWPASLRRVELQALPDMIGAAMVQQFRRTRFFNAVLDEVPGLNWLGKDLRVDKTPGFELREGEIVPLTQIVADFRIDVSAWDRYLEQDARTVDEPFERTLKDLETIIGTIGGVREDTDLSLGADSAGITVGVEQSTDQDEEE